MTGLPANADSAYTRLSVVGKQGPAPLRLVGWNVVNRMALATVVASDSTFSPFQAEADVQPMFMLSFQPTLSASTAVPVGSLVMSMRSVVASVIGSIPSYWSCVSEAKGALSRID